MLTKLFVRLQSHLVREEGASAVEYGLLLVIIAAVAGAIIALRTQITGVFQDVVDALSGI